MKVKGNLVKFTTAAALTVAGLGAVNTLNPSSTSAHVEAATKKVTINYIPGYGINVWDNYEDPGFTGTRLQHGKTVHILRTAVDKQGQKWYQIGDNQWIQARYTKKAFKHPQIKTAFFANEKGSAASLADRVVDIANTEVGKAYAWGSNGPNAFDCSGLVQYVYGKAGKGLSRTTYSQVKQGRTVSMQDLKPGDLLYWGSPTAPHHVGIYVGDNQFIHAATPSQGVIKETLSSYFYPSVAKRVLD